MATIFKRKTDRNRRGSPWYIAYFDETGRRRYLTGCSDRQATELIASRLESDVELRKRGVLDATAERFAAHGRRDLIEHVEAFLQHVNAKGRAKRYVFQVRARLNAFIGFAETKRLSDFTPARVDAFILKLRGESMSGVTINEYIGTLKALSKWATMTGRCAADPLASVRKLDAKAITKTRPRRALSPDEVGCLLEAAERRPLAEVLMV